MLFRSTSGSNLSLTETMALLGILPSISWPLDIEEGLFKPLGTNSSGKRPNLENLGISKSNPALAEIMWAELLKSAGSAQELTATTNQLVLHESLKQLQGTTIAYLSENEGLATSVTVSGRILVGRRNGQDFPGEGFLVKAIRGSDLERVNSVTSQTDSTGLFYFKNESRLTGGDLFHFEVTVKDPGLSEPRGIQIGRAHV